MSGTLISISFPGKGRMDNVTGYKTACYAFPDGRMVTTPFFGLALKEVIRPDRMTLFGSRGSI